MARNRIGTIVFVSCMSLIASGVSAVCWQEQVASSCANSPGSTYNGTGACPDMHVTTANYYTTFAVSGTGSMTKSLDSATCSWQPRCQGQGGTCVNCGVEVTHNPGGTRATGAPCGGNPE